MHLGAMQQPTESREEGGSIRRRHNFCIKELLDDQQLVGLPLVGIIWHHFEVQRLERVVRVDGNLALQMLNLRVRGDEPVRFDNKY